jgi:Thiolase, C-terminal domain
LATAGIGPSVAIPDVVRRGGISMEDVDVFEVNEAFASQVHLNATLLFLFGPTTSLFLSHHAAMSLADGCQVHNSTWLAVPCWLSHRTGSR